MWPIVTDGVAWSVCRSVIIVSPAKTAEPIKLLFGLWTRVNPMNCVLDGVQIPMKGGNFGRPIVKYRDSAVSCAEMAEPIKMPFWMWTEVVQGSMR